MATSETGQTEPLLLQLALALVDRPGSSLQELAKAVGVSKATLYRFCPTRDELVERLLEEATGTVVREVEGCNLEHAPIDDAMHALINSHLANKELTLFLVHHWRPELLMESNPDTRWLSIQKAYDRFFLRAQQEGKLRIDISAVALTEIFSGIMFSIVDAERRGRIPRTEMAVIMEKMFLNGAMADATERVRN